MPKLLLHIGYPRTGTTSLQKFMVSARDALSLRGIYIPEDIGFRHRHLQLAGLRGKNAKVASMVGLSETSDIDAELARYFSAAAIAPDGCDTAFMSEETVALKSASELEQMQAILSPHFEDIHVYVCFREHTGYLFSDYSQRIRTTFQQISFPQFAQRIEDNGHLELTEKMDALKRIFGDDKVTMLFHGADSQNSSSRRIVELIAGQSVADTFSEERANASIDIEHIELKRMLNPRISRLIQQNDGKINAQVQELVTEFTKALANEAKIDLSDVSKKSIINKVAAPQRQKWADDWQDLTTLSRFSGNRV